MAIFAIVASTEPNKVKQAVTTQYGANHFQFGPMAWFVADDGSSKQVADKLGITDNKLGGQAVVLLITAYSGYGPTAGWTWLQQRGSAIANG